MQNRDFIIIAHRGESFEAPENTLSSINLAWQKNDDAVEIDIRMTKDDKIIVIHDNNTFRTGRKFMNVSSCSYDELLKVDVGKFKGNNWKNEKIPLLDEVINMIPKDRILFVEIKSNYKIVKPLQELINQKQIDPNQINFIGFNFKTMSLVKKKLSEFKSYWIIGKKSILEKIHIEDIILKCKSSKLNGVDIKDGKYLNKDLIHSVKKSGLKIYTWTVDDPVRAKQLVLDGIDGITSNKAFWLGNQLQFKKVE